MSSSDPVEFSGEIDSFEEPIRGLLRDGQGRAVSFRGWMELAAALTALAEDAVRPTSTSNTRGAINE